MLISDLAHSQLQHEGVYEYLVALFKHLANLNKANHVRSFGAWIGPSPNLPGLLTPIFENLMFLW